MDQGRRNLFADGNSNRVADSYFLSRCGNLIDNQSGLKGRIVACRQQSNVQVSGMKLPLGVFIGQSFDDWHLSLNWSRPALTLDVKSQRHKRNCWQHDSRHKAYNQQCHKKL